MVDRLRNFEPAVHNDDAIIVAVRLYVQARLIFSSEWDIGS